MVFQKYKGKKAIFIFSAFAISAILFFVVFISVKFLKNATEESLIGKEEGGGGIQFEFEKLESIGIIKN